MSEVLLRFACSFACGRMTASVFSSAFIELWKIERDLNLLKEDTADLSECLSSIFCAADAFEFEPNRAEHELDEAGLLELVRDLLSKLGSKGVKVDIA